MTASSDSASMESRISTTMSTRAGLGNEDQEALDLAARIRGRVDVEVGAALVQCELQRRLGAGRRGAAIREELGAVRGGQREVERLVVRPRRRNRKADERRL